MKNLKPLLLLLLSFVFAKDGLAHVGPISQKAKESKNTVRFRGGDCAPATKQIDQDINNVRARLLNGGDVWWDGNSNGRYIVPKVPAGQPEVSSLFAGAVWVGGFDPGGSLKLAAKTYGSGNGQTDFYPGPLNQFNGGTSQEDCSNWDRFFKVTAEEIKEHLRLYNKSQREGTPYTEEMIPAGVKGWPSPGNPHFLENWGFELPRTGQGLAGYLDDNSNGYYDPLGGDFPIVEITGCLFGNQQPPSPAFNECPDEQQYKRVPPQFPDEMIFWVYNDAGGKHSETGAEAINMEIQVQSFAYATNDFINNMTFQRYKLINRAVEDLTQCYFAMWVDPDLGCHTDDLIGCDTTRSMMYVYNQDAADGQTGCTCPGGVNTYCNDIPILGVDYFRGPKGREFCYDPITGAPMIDTLTGDTMTRLVELGMSSFTYYNNQAFGNPPAGTTDPQTAEEFYNYLTGRWRDGSPFQSGGCGYNTGGVGIDYAYPDPPNCTDPACWNMCEDCNTEGDRRTIQSTGPFTLKPGDINELIVGVVWLPSQDYPCPDISELQKADDIAQALFDNCFDITDGPDAPDVDWLELDQSIVGILTNDKEVSNNASEKYREIDLNAPQTLPEEQREYRFEGYKVFQLANSRVSVTELDDLSKAIPVFQSDVDNKVGKIYNWEAVENPNPGQADIWVPSEKVQVQNPDQGITRTFKITEDLFTQSTDRRLINHKKYYFLALSYAHNNWSDFDPFANGGVGSGQRKSYLEGRGNIRTYTVIPRPLTYDVLAAEYGESVEITRIDGVGAGTHFLDVSDEMRDKMISPDFNHEITYKADKGPFDIIIYNPLDVEDGDFELTLVDENLDDDELDDPEKVNWQLTNINSGEVFLSENSIDKLNEQLVLEYGFSIKLKDGLLPGNFYFENSKADPANGAIGYEEEYADPLAAKWLSGVPDDFSTGTVGANLFDYTQTGLNEPDNELDSLQAFKQLGEGYFTPYYLCDYRDRPSPYISPALKNNGRTVRQFTKGQGGLEKMNNVDIVFTSDKSKWSRSLIVESSVPDVTALGFETEGNRNHFDWRASPSVGKEDADGDGLPDPDGDGEGMGWFPGYAVDVETGQRLNIFFGEASIYRCDEASFQNFFNACNAGIFDNNQPTGADMMWNPTSQGAITNVPQSTNGAWQAITGGMHFIYVTDLPYDGCESIRSSFDPANPLQKVRALPNVTWTAYPVLQPGTEFLSYADGLIPNDLTVKLRVDNPFAVAEGTGEKNGYPTYRFSLKNKEARDVADETEIANALDEINVVPNPYYGFSPYETSQFATTVKITNLPAKCKITIYSLDGKFIRTYNRDERPPVTQDRSVGTFQIYPDLEWDLRNSKGIPVASGVYLIHVEAPGFGERVLKWFGVARQYDPSGL